MMTKIQLASDRTFSIAGALAMAVCSIATLAPTAQAQTTLSDGPIFATQAVPGNVALPLSVEWPTVQRQAHTAAYSPAAEFLGYFDPKKCYTYKYDGSDTALRPTDVTKVTYFQPAGLAAAHVCVGQWSGNFLNWAMTHTIDPFRWALTGGFRVVDTPTLTILENAWSDSHTGLFPDRSISAALATGATPFNFALSVRIDGLGNKMRFTGTGNLGNAPTAYTGSGGVVAGTTYDVFTRARVCDGSSGTGGVESNCVVYGSNWKPEGLIQQYANKMRFSVFGYLRDSSPTRDGGVLRARQKFVGPTSPVPGSAAVTNGASEWDPATGVFVRNPDATDATATNTAFAPSVNVIDSGVMNYLNKFGELSPVLGASAYKDYDPVSELYYAAVRYFKNLGNVPEYSNMTGSTAAAKTTLLDGFPVITSWTDPIQYSCQRNFVLGIGDIYTWNDKNLPGAGTGTVDEPTKPPAVLSDGTVNAVTATNKAFALEGLGTPNWSSYSGRSNSAGIVGLAYDSHTKDIRTDLPGLQTIDTYWVDVLEQPFVANNQYYLAAKYGGFTMPAGYDTYGNSTALTASWWHTPTGSPDTNTVGAQLRPDNYFTGGKPDLMIAGLNAAFSKIASQLTAYTTSFSTSLPQVAQAGNASYSSLYDPNNWTGEVVASTLSFDLVTGQPSLTQNWKFTDRLTTQLAGTGWTTAGKRRVVTWNGTTGAQFCSGTPSCTTPLTAAQLTALNTGYIAGNDSANYLNYLRGDKLNEQGTVGGTMAYRTRAKALGDIVGSKSSVVGPPSLPLSDATNPGYAAFRAAWSARPTIVYIGANDGMMHAIHGDLTSLTTPPGGTELFAYVPSALFQGPTGTPNVNGLASLGNPSFQHHFMVNATPVVFDVDMARTVGSSGAPNWRSILVGGLGKGGRSYYAIDVTDPIGMYNGGEAAVASKVLWEFTDPDLGYTFGEPVVAKTLKYGWVVIIPSGYNNADGVGRLFILNARTGTLLEKISTGTGSPANSAGLAHANGYVTDYSDGTIDAVYAGDLLGNVWRLDLTATSGAYPAPTKLASLMDPSVSPKPQPITARPLIEIHPTMKKRFVLVGTGRLLDSSDISNVQPQTFYTIADGSAGRFNLAADLPSGVTFPITRAKLIENTNGLVGVTDDPAKPMGWYEDLGLTSPGVGAGWRVASDATSVLNQVAWAAILPSGDACNPSGTSRVYARDFGTAASSIGTKVGSTFTPMLYKDVGGLVTDLRYLSVNGKAVLISGTDSGELKTLDITPAGIPGIRRLNWRELQTVE
ncbi:MAG: PilC/PilY family type IV pilus protein [Burkholderiales bacterium]